MEPTDLLEEGENGEEFEIWVYPRKKKDTDKNLSIENFKQTNILNKYICHYHTTF